MNAQRVLTTLLCCLFSIVAIACARPDTERREQNRPHPLAIGDLNWQQIDALDRNKTIFLLTVGMLEEHGPHLPIASDTIGVEYEARGVAAAVRMARPDWQVVQMPTVPYGASGANQIGNVAIHPGTYAVRQSTLRSLVTDLGAQIAQNGFKWIFVLNGHGAPTHHMAVNDASDFVSDVFDVTMLNVSALFTADRAVQAEGEAILAKYFSAMDRASFGMDQHAGVSETSGVLAIRPDLVDPEYRGLPNQRVESRIEMIAMASKPGWLGYFSSPARATAAYGEEVEAWWIRGMSNLILAALGGEDLRARPRWPEQLRADPAYAQIMEATLGPDRGLDAQFERWLAQRQ